MTTDIQKIIEKSGNNFHAKVVNFLREEDWAVQVSPFYSDNQKNVSREIDIIAEKIFPVPAWMNRSAAYLIVQLYIECKYIPKEIVFWVDDKDLEAAEEMVIKTTPLPRNNICTKKHHYCAATKVAKIFSSTKDRLENEPMFTAIQQSLNSLIYYRPRKKVITKKSALPPGNAHRIFYPIILCNDFEKFYRVNFGSTQHQSVEGAFFELEVNYSFIDKHDKKADEYFIIDVVNFSKASDYLKMIAENDVHSIIEVMDS